MLKNAPPFFVTIAKKFNAWNATAKPVIELYFDGGKIKENEKKS